jgi:hypothetical protein
VNDAQLIVQSTVYHFQVMRNYMYEKNHVQITNFYITQVYSGLSTKLFVQFNSTDGITSGAIRN